MDLSAPFLDHSFPLPLDHPFTRHAALEAGLDGRALTRLCRAGHLRRPIKGIYVSSHLPDNLDLRVEMVKLFVPPGAVVTDRTAGWIHGAQMILAPGDHLVAPRLSVFGDPAKGRLRNNMTASGERTLARRDVVEIDGLRVTTPLRTAADLGRLLHRAQALAAIDSLLRLKVFTLEELIAEIDRFRGFRGVVQLRLLVPIADPGSASPGESALRLHWYDAGLPRPRTQIPVVEGGREVAYLDMGLEELLFAAEYDGEEWHTSDEDRDHDSTRRKWLRDHRGWQIEPLVGRNVYGLHQDADIVLRRAYEEARCSFPQRAYIL